MIREAREADLLRLQEIERAAGRVFADVGMQAMADAEPLPLETLRGYLQDGTGRTTSDAGSGCWRTTS